MAGQGLIWHSAENTIFTSRLDVTRFERHWNFGNLERVSTDTCHFLTAKDTVDENGVWLTIRANDYIKNPFILKSCWKGWGFNSGQNRVSTPFSSWVISHWIQKHTRYWRRICKSIWRKGICSIGISDQEQGKVPPHQDHWVSGT